MLLYPKRHRPARTRAQLPSPSCKATGIEQTEAAEGVSRTQTCSHLSGNLQANTTSLQGFACLAHVTSPSHFWPAWLRVYRPRIESLMRAASNAPPKPSALLPLLDELLYEIKQVSVPALHCSERHASHEWREAAAQVYSACHKYEQYMLRNRGLYSKVMEAERRLHKAQASKAGDYGKEGEGQGSLGYRGVQQASCQPASGSSNAEHKVAHSSGRSGAHGLQRAAEQEHLSSNVLLHLAQTLLHLFERRGAAVQDEFSTSHFALAHVPDTEDPAWQECMHVVRAERELAAGVRVCVAGASSSPVLPLIYVDWADGESSQDYLQEQGRGDAQPPWADDPILLPLLRRTPNLHTYNAEGSISSSSNDRDAGAKSWGAVLLLDSVATSQVLCHHPNPSLRQAVYEAGLESRMEAALHLRSQMAAARAVIAGVNRAPSYAHLMTDEPRQQQQQQQQERQQQEHTAYQGIQQACSGGFDAATGTLVGGSTTPKGVQGRVEGSERLLHACARAVQGAADQQVRHMAAQMGPICATGAQPQEAASAARLPSCDVSYAQHQLLHSQGLNVQYEHVRAYLSLRGIIEGLGDVLYKSMGLKLRFLNTTSDPGGEGSANGSLATDVWDAGVIRLVLESWGGGNAGANADALPVPLGVCYVDPGGGYGTRQLRFSRRAQSSRSPSRQKATEGPSTSAAEYTNTDWEQLPVVSVGLQQPWRQGYAGKLAAVMELLHELGHAVHLIASSYAAPYKLFGGLHLPLEVLEVPSILFERFAMDPRSLQAICRLPTSANDQAQGQVGPPRHMDTETAQRLSMQLKAQHSSALDFQEQVLVALGDHLLNAEAPVPTNRQPSDAASVFTSLWERYSSIPHVPASLKRLSSLPVACHHQATFWVYVSAWCCACGLWERYLAPDPLGLSTEGAEAGRALLYSLLERGSYQNGHNQDPASTSSLTDIVYSTSVGLESATLLATPENFAKWLYNGTQAF